MVPRALVFCVSASGPPWGGGRQSQSSPSFISFYKVSFHIWFSLTKKRFLAARKYLKTTGTDEAVRLFPIFRAEISSLLIHWIENPVSMQSPLKSTSMAASCSSTHWHHLIAEITKIQSLWPYPTWGLCRDRQPGAYCLCTIPEQL